MYKNLYFYQMKSILMIKKIQKYSYSYVNVHKYNLEWLKNI